MSVAKRNSPPRPEDARELRDASRPARSAASNAGASATDRDRSDRRARANRPAARRAGRSASPKCSRIFGRAARLDRRQRLGHAVDERLDADEAGARMRSACAIRCSPPPKPISSRTRVDRLRKQRAQVGRRGPIEIERKPRQQRLEQRRLARPQRMPLAPAEERAALRDVSPNHDCRSWCRARASGPSEIPCLAAPRATAPRDYGSSAGRHDDAVDGSAAQRNARLSVSARSVRSQEKPPSFSGARPKWP